MLFPRLVSIVSRNRFLINLSLALATSLVAGYVAADNSESLYHKHCAVCHGENGDGRGRAGANFQPPATNFSGYAQSRDYMLAAVINGKPGTPMVGYARRLDADEIAGVVDFIRSRFMPAPAVMKNSDATPSPGRELYVAHCAACHGDDGNTAVWARNGLQPAPRDFTSPAASEELSLERMLTSVTNGRPGTAMMSFRGRLSDAQIADVVEYVRTAFMKNPDGFAAPFVHDEVPLRDNHATPAQPIPASLDRSAPMPKGLVGNVKRGREFFMRNCHACHGRNGDGTGPRAYFNRPPPRNFTSDESRQRFNRPLLFNAISRGKPGSVMPAWSTVLDEQQIADVAEFVFNAFIESKPAGAEKKSPHLALPKKSAPQ